MQTALFSPRLKSDRQCSAARHSPNTSYFKYHLASMYADADTFPLLPIPRECAAPIY